MSSSNTKNNKWEYVTLDKVVDKGSSNLSLNKIKDDEGDYPIFSAKGFYKNISFYHQEKEYIAIIKDGAGIGRLSVHPPKSSVVGTMQYLIPKEGFDLMFIKYFLTGVNFVAYKQGATIPHIYFKDYKVELVPKLPLEEQKRLVAKIDILFAKIDKAISLTEESLKQAKNLLPSSVKKLFEDGETKGWKKLKFKDFASLRHGHQFRKYDYVENGIPVVKIGQCIPGDRLDLTKCNFIDKSRETEFSNDLICKGDLLMALTGGTLGKVTWVKDDYGVVVQNYRVGNFFTDEKLSSKRFLMYALLSPIFQTLMYSKINVAAQPNIGKDEIENLEFILPSLEEQSKVVDRLDDLTSKAKQTQSKLEEQLAYLKQLKSSILSKAFSGNL